MDRDEASRFRQLLERRLTGEPIAYILGEREFYGRLFSVDSRVLIPRPETEHLIEAALDLDLRTPKVLDIGSGSGCIAITLALEIAGARLVASDRSPAALAVATGNARRHRVEPRVHCVGSDLAEAIRISDFDLVVSNPPYIDPGVRDQLSREVTDFEPRDALFAKRSGLEVLARCLEQLTALTPGTPVLLEIGYDQGEAVRQLAEEAGHVDVEVRRDLAGHPRVAQLRSGR